MDSELKTLNYSSGVDDLLGQLECLAYCGLCIADSRKKGVNEVGRPALLESGDGIDRSLVFLRSSLRGFSGLRMEGLPIRILIDTGSKIGVHSVPRVCDHSLCSSLSSKDWKELREGELFTAESLEAAC